MKEMSLNKIKLIHLNFLSVFAQFSYKVLILYAQFKFSILFLFHEMYYNCFKC